MLPGGGGAIMVVVTDIVLMWLLYLLPAIVPTMRLLLYFRIGGYRLTTAELLMVMSSYLVTGPELGCIDFGWGIEARMSYFFFPTSKLNATSKPM